MDGFVAECCDRITRDHTLAHHVAANSGKQDKTEDVDIKKALTGHTHWLTFLKKKLEERFSLAHIRQDLANFS